MIPGFFAGIDIGASGTKVVILDGDKSIKGFNVRRSGTDFALAASSGFEGALSMAGISSRKVAGVFSTGYGRDNVDFASGKKTEIACHGKGCYFYFGNAMTIVDIGGQDNKIIRLDSTGRREGFKMNRKCAAGTGAFLEEMAARLDIPLSSMNELAQKATNMVKLGSYCTVFSATEVLEHIRKGKPISDIVKGVFFSMIHRVMEMEFLSSGIVMTGGVVAHNPYLVEMARQILKQEIRVPEYPQLTGALGAALYAMEQG